MIPLSHLFDYYSKRHYEFQMGWSIVGQISAFITFETFAMVLCTKLNLTGYPAMAIYAGVPMAALIGVTILGHKMIGSGYASKLQQYGMNVNKDWEGMVQNIKWMREQMGTPEELIMWEIK
jgi:hypothetical protein